MGLPALKREPVAAPRRPQLRVVSETSVARKPSRRAASNRAARQLFATFTSVLVVVALLGVGRVWLSVQAAQASIDCGRLQSAIKSARYEGDMLEIQQSALATPSRIQAIAVGSMGMAPATSVSYLRIDPATHAQTLTAETPSGATEAGPPLVRKLMGVAAAEARLLLVGDAGLSSSK